jgi:superoxide dismutase, Cu-Zn family
MRTTSLTLCFALLGAGALLVGSEPRERQQIEPKLPEHAVAVLYSTRGQQARGVIEFTQTRRGVRITGTVGGLEPGLHGFHIHEFGDLRSPDGKSAGDHFNPTGEKHGAPGHEQHHYGDLGNIEANQEGVATVNILADWMKLHFIVGRGLVVHAGADDLESQPSGDAGDRAAVGVIGIAQPQAARQADAPRRSSD